VGELGRKTPPQTTPSTKKEGDQETDKCLTKTELKRKGARCASNRKEQIVRKRLLQGNSQGKFPPKSPVGRNTRRGGHPKKTTVTLKYVPGITGKGLFKISIGTALSEPTEGEKRG